MGQSNKEQIDREKPDKIDLKNVVQIYAGENMSFAVDKFGSTYAWGENKHNCLMLDNSGGYGAEGPPGGGEEKNKKMKNKVD